MSGEKQTTIWEPKTFDCIRQNSSIFKSVAERIGIPPEALAGAMARENNAYNHHRGREIFMDIWALKCVPNVAASFI